MLKRLAVNIAIAIVLVFIAILMNDFGIGSEAIRVTIGVGGIGYGILSVCYILFTQVIPLINTLINNATNERAKIKAQNMLLKYKDLLDKGILTEDEFTAKYTELKDKI